MARVFVWYFPRRPQTPSDDFFGGSEDHLEEDDPTLSLDEMEAGELDVVSWRQVSWTQVSWRAQTAGLSWTSLYLLSSSVLDPPPLLLLRLLTWTTVPSAEAGAPGRKRKTLRLLTWTTVPSAGRAPVGEDSDSTGQQSLPRLPSREEDEDSETSDLDNSPLRRGRRPREEDEDEEEEPSSKRPHLSYEDKPSTWVPPLPTPSTLMVQPSTAPTLMESSGTTSITTSETPGLGRSKQLHMPSSAGPISSHLLIS
ncbi:hypothetical protein WMY93_005891 [Mugilogobius chulae]|uniref:Uncharacterized protein n=1 Tax=Mugilogobius chulae TaxID=88201 RepID=A0AAW0PKV1_9GOBI